MKNSIITRTNPFGLIDPFFDEFFTGESNSSLNQLMRTDITDEGDYYQLKVDLPEVKKEDIKLSLDEGYLTIEATQQNEDNEKKHGHFVRRERYYGSYKRSFYIGEDILQEDIKAKLNDGVLTLIVNKRVPEEKEPNYIEIE